MRPTALAILVAASVAGVASAQDDGKGYNATCGEFDCRVEPVRSQWQLLDVKRDRRSLKLAYLSGGCLRGDGKANIMQTRARIRIEVEQGRVVAIDSPTGEVVCTGERSYKTLFVPLKRVIAGRDIIGGPRLDDEVLPNRRTTGRRGRVIALAPRVLGLAANDARALLVGQGLRVERSGDRVGRVVRQSPAPGGRPEEETVEITVRR